MDYHWYDRECQIWSTSTHYPLTSNAKQWLRCSSWKESSSFNLFIGQDEPLESIAESSPCLYVCYRIERCLSWKNWCCIRLAGILQVLGCSCTFPPYCGLEDCLFLLNSVQQILQGCSWFWKIYAVAFHENPSILDKRIFSYQVCFSISLQFDVYLLRVWFLVSHQKLYLLIEVVLNRNRNHQMGELKCYVIINLPDYFKPKFFSSSQYKLGWHIHWSWNVTLQWTCQV